MKDCETLRVMTDDTPGIRLRKAREHAGFRSARAAANKFHWTASTYASHENGQTPEIPHVAARKYARSFKVSSAWLLSGEGDMLGTVTKGHIERLIAAVPPEKLPQAVDFLEYLAGQKPKR